MKKIYSLLIVLVSLGFVACDDKLDLSPENEIGEDAAFASVEDLESGKIGLYGNFSSMSMITLNSRASDDLRLIPSNTGQGVSVHNWTYTASDDDMEGIWNGNYKNIDFANRIIEAANKFGEGENAEQLKIINETKAHCLFVRAHSHFEIVRAYCENYTAEGVGIPFMNKYSVEAKPARLAQDSVYKLIKADITEALKYLPSTDFDRGFANVHVANALMARVALYQKDYANAITYANKVINESNVRLADRAEIGDLWLDDLDSDIEILFELKKVTGNAELGSIFLRTTNDDVFFQPSVDLESKYTATDIRKDVYFGELDSQTIVKKHFGIADAKNLVNFKLYRLSEMYFILAEAYAKTDKLVDAANAIFEITKRRDSAVTLAPSYTNVSGALDNILLEKRKEMAYEGHRFIDLKRFGKGIVRVGVDAELASGVELEANNYKFVFPIPQAEMFANDNMIQNTGY